MLRSSSHGMCTSLFIALNLSSAFAFANDRVIYDVKTKPTLAEFRLELDSPRNIQGRANLINTTEGATFSSGNSGFTLWKFADLKSENFDLKTTFQIPPGIRYSNSGIYFLYTDPNRAYPQELEPKKRDAFLQALDFARDRSARFGVGPYEADFFARELQIISGFENGLPAENHGVGAFYGVNPVTGGEAPAGQQQLSPYDAFIGDTYELTVEARGTTITTFMQSLTSQSQRVQVAKFKNLTRDADPIRGGSPVALMLQGFPNNGQDVKAPVFKNITLNENPTGNP
jgi:hypothetical protein